MAGKDKDIKMELSQIRIDENRGEQVIVLKEAEGERRIPIVIGVSEVAAIKMHLSGIKTPRPLTHDLLNGVITQLGGTLDRVVVNKLEHNIFYAKLVIKMDGRVVEVDARPSDSIAVALKVSLA